VGILLSCLNNHQRIGNSPGNAQVGITPSVCSVDVLSVRSYLRRGSVDFMTIIFRIADEFDRATSGRTD
jgi:hypothetical protein